MTYSATFTGLDFVDAPGEPAETPGARATLRLSRPATETEMPEIRAVDLAAMFNSVRAIADWYVMKMPAAEREEFEGALKYGVLNMGSLVRDDWSEKVDPQSYRDALSRELQRLLTLPRRDDK